MRRQNALTLSSDIVQESDFSDTAYNSAYVSDLQSLIAKSNEYFSTKISWHKIEVFGDMWNF